MTYAAISGPNPWDFSIVSTTCPLTLPVGDTCGVTFSFMPGGQGYRQAGLIIADDSPDAPHIVSLSGTGLSESLIFTPIRWQFSAHPVGQTSGPGKFYVLNSTSRAAKNITVYLEGPNPADFKITGNTCISPLAMLATCTVTFTFTPLAKGTRMAYLTIASDATIVPQVTWITAIGQ